MREAIMALFAAMSVSVLTTLAWNVCSFLTINQVYINYVEVTYNITTLCATFLDREQYKSSIWREMALSSWRENFSSGVSFLRRRFSSNDLQADDDRLDVGDTDSADTTGLNFNLPRGQRGRSRPSPSAPSSPSKSSSSGYGAFARGLFSSAAGSQRPAYNKDRCKTLLVIDQPHIDWSVTRPIL